LEEKWPPPEGAASRGGNALGEKVSEYVLDRDEPVSSIAEGLVTAATASNHVSEAIEDHEKVSALSASNPIPAAARLDLVCGATTM
jgi:hypothetical protein